MNCFADYLSGTQILQLLLSTSGASPVGEELCVVTLVNLLLLNLGVVRNKKAGKQTASQGGREVWHQNERMPHV